MMLDLFCRTISTIFFVSMPHSSLIYIKKIKNSMTLKALEYEAKQRKEDNSSILVAIYEAEMEGFKNLCSFASILDGAGCIVMTYLDFLLLQAQAQQIEYHYDHVQVKDANSGRLSLPILCSLKKFKKKKKNLCSQWGGY